METGLSTEVLALVIDPEIDALRGRTVAKDRTLAFLAARQELAERMRRHGLLATETVRAAGVSWDGSTPPCATGPGGPPRLPAARAPNSLGPVAPTATTPAHLRGPGVTEPDERLWSSAPTAGRGDAGSARWHGPPWNIALAAHPDHQGWAAPLGVRDSPAVSAHQDTAAPAVTALRAAGLVALEHLERIDGRRRSGYRLHLPEGVLLQTCPNNRTAPARGTTARTGGTIGDSCSVSSRSGHRSTYQWRRHPPYLL